MKTGVITVYNSMNCGSFLQAYAMDYALRSLGYHPVFLDTKSRIRWKVAGKAFLGRCVKLKFEEAFRVVRKARAYGQYTKMLSIEKMTAKCDAYILGSDELWNMTRRNMYNYPVFWGVGFPPEHTISYAPSLNTATAEDVAKFPFAIEMLESMYAVSVRDQKSKDELKKITGRTIEVVCDPSFLCQRSAYEILEEDLERKNYIFVYDFSKITSEEITWIREYARVHGKKIVAMGVDHKWADEVVVSVPGKFLSLLKNADAVITGTFHGTAFSIIYKKKLASLARKNAKVHELLREYHLEDRIVTETNTLEKILNLPVEESRIEQIMCLKREAGLAYLERNLKNILGSAGQC